MCPIVPIFRCGLLRSNFSFAIALYTPQLECSRASSQKINLAVSQRAASTARTLSRRAASTARTLLASRPAGCLRDHFLGDRRGCLGIMREMHGKARAALRAAADVGGVPKHLRERNFHTNHVGAAARLSALNLAATRIQI